MPCRPRRTAVARDARRRESDSSRGAASSTRSGRSRSSVPTTSKRCTARRCGSSPRSGSRSSATGRWTPSGHRYDIMALRISSGRNWLTRRHHGSIDPRPARVAGDGMRLGRRPPSAGTGSPIDGSIAVDATAPRAPGRGGPSRSLRPRGQPRKSQSHLRDRAPEMGNIPPAPGGIPARVTGRGNIELKIPRRSSYLGAVGIGLLPCTPWAASRRTRPPATRGLQARNKPAMAPPDEVAATAVRPTDGLGRLRGHAPSVRRDRHGSETARNGRGVKAVAPPRCGDTVEAGGRCWRRAACTPPTSPPQLAGETTSWRSAPDPS